MVIDGRSSLMFKNQQRNSYGNDRGGVEKVKRDSFKNKSVWVE